MTERPLQGGTAVQAAGRFTAGRPVPPIVAEFHRLYEFEGEAQAYRMASDFAAPTVAIAKQRTPVGLASNDDAREAYRRALAADPVTAYGAVVAFNREVDEAMARELVLNPFEGVAAPASTEGARALLSGRPELAALKVPAPPPDGLPDYGIAELDFQRIEGGLLVETKDALEGALTRRIEAV